MKKVLGTKCHYFRLQPLTDKLIATCVTTVKCVVIWVCDSLAVSPAQHGRGKPFSTLFPPLSLSIRLFGVTTANHPIASSTSLLTHTHTPTWFPPSTLLQIKSLAVARRVSSLFNIATILQSSNLIPKRWCKNCRGRQYEKGWVAGERLGKTQSSGTLIGHRPPGIGLKS